MTRKSLLILISISLVVSGCATISKNRSNCIIAGAAIGAAAGGYSEDDDKGEAAIGGAVIGGLIAMLTCHPDEDQDGITDENDRCPMTPAGITVDATGCPLDNDNDGVPDYLDRCPGTAEGANVNSDGCVEDGDGDGVTDDMDKCPGTPAGTEVDNRGCAMDADGDGVPDSMDQCPGTPAGREVDSAGCGFDDDGDGVGNLTDRCPKTPRGAEVDTSGCLVKLNLPSGSFAFDSFTLTISTKSTLDSVASTLKENEQVSILIEGHTDSHGESAYNQKLSEQRARAVRDYLIKQGIPSTRLQTRGYGETAPIASNADAGGQAKNRRVELKVIGS